MINVLDHGFVELVDSMGDDKRIVQAARVSTKGYVETQELTKRDEKLIHYLVKNKHTSPLEQVAFVFRIKMPIFVARQFVRHRTAKLNEISGRYAELPREYYVPSPSRIKKQDSINKQGSAESLPEMVGREVTSYMESMAKIEMTHYDWCLGKGVAREIARINLPLSVYTEWFWQIDLHNLFHFLELRMHSHAQWEAQQYANAIAQIVKEKVPVAWEAFSEYRLDAVTLSKTDAQFLGKLLEHLEQIPSGSRDEFYRLADLLKAKVE